MNGGVRIYEAAPRAWGVPRQVNRPPSVFVDRDELFARLDALLAAVRGGSVQFALLVGLAGVGKTVSLDQWVLTRPQEFVDGVLSADLRGFGPGAPVEAYEIAGRFLRALGIDSGQVPVDPEERLALYRSEIAGRDLLIILDNAASVIQVRRLLPAGPGPMVVATSRRSLHALTRDGARTIRLDPLEHDYATQLLLEAAAEKVLDCGAGAEIERAARLCAGLPLALSLVAEHVAHPQVTLRELVNQLEDDRRILDELASRDAPQDAVRAAFDGLYRALSPQCAAFFRALGFHTGPHLAPQAAAALAGVDLATAAAHLRTLEDLHMVEPVEHGRYRLHDLLRTYAREHARRLDDPPQRQALARLLDWYARTGLAAAQALGTATLPVQLPAQHLAPEVITFTDQWQALEWFERERSGLPEALATAAEHGDPIAWKLPAALLGLFTATNAFDEWTQANTVGYQAAHACRDREAIAAMAESAGKAARQLHRLAQASALLEEAINERRELGDARGIARLTNVLGLVAAENADWVQAARYFQDAIDAALHLEDVHMAAFAQVNLAWVLDETGRYAEALTCLDRAGQTLAAPGWEAQYSNVLQLRAGALRGLGQTDPALEAAREAVEICRRVGNQVSLAQTLRELALSLAAADDGPGALDALDEALALHQRHGDLWRAAGVHQAAAAIHRALRQTERAREQYAIAAGIYRSLDDEAQAERCDTLATELTPE